MSIKERPLSSDMRPGEGQSVGGAVEDMVTGGEALNQLVDTGNDLEALRYVMMEYGGRGVWVRPEAVCFEGRKISPDLDEHLVRIWSNLVEVRGYERNFFSEGMRVEEAIYQASADFLKRIWEERKAGVARAEGEPGQKLVIFLLGPPYSGKSHLHKQLNGLWDYFRDELGIQTNHAHFEEGVRRMKSEQAEARGGVVMVGNQIGGVTPKRKLTKLELDRSVAWFKVVTEQVLKQTGHGVVVVEGPVPTTFHEGGAWGYNPEKTYIDGVYDFVVRAGLNVNQLVTATVSVVGSPDLELLVHPRTAINRLLQAYQILHEHEISEVYQEPDPLERVRLTAEQGKLYAWSKLLGAMTGRTLTREQIESMLLAGGAPPGPTREAMAYARKAAESLAERHEDTRVKAVLDSVNDLEWKGNQMDLFDLTNKILMGEVRAENEYVGIEEMGVVMEIVRQADRVGRVMGKGRDVARLEALYKVLVTQVIENAVYIVPEHRVEVELAEKRFWRRPTNYHASVISTPPVAILNELILRQFIAAVERSESLIAKGENPLELRRGYDEYRRTIEGLSISLGRLEIPEQERWLEFLVDEGEDNWDAVLGREMAARLRSRSG